MLYRDIEYYFLLGKVDDTYRPLLIDMITSKKLGNAITTVSIGTVFTDLSTAKKARRRLERKFSEVIICRLKAL